MKIILLSGLLLFSITSFCEELGINDLRKASNKETTLIFPHASEDLLSSSLQAFGGTNIGGGDIGSEFLAEWCHNQIEKLYAFKQRAYLKLNASGNYYKANKILLNGLIAGAQSSKGNQSFTNRALVRGVELFTILEAQDITKSKREKRNINRIMNEYYSFITQISLTLDVKEYIPFKKAHEENSLKSFDGKRFEKKIVEYAAAQLKWFLDTFTFTRGLEFMAIGKTSNFLKATEITLEGVKSDVVDSLFKYRLNCSLQKITVLFDIVVQYNLGNEELFDNDRVAENYVIAQIKEIHNSITFNENCF